MAGQKVIETMRDGQSVITVIENGNVEEGDEWGLFRLTDEGLEAYRYGAEFREGIMAMKIDGQPAVQEVDRLQTQAEAVEARGKLPEEERARTLIRSVRPKDPASEVATFLAPDST